MNNLWSKIPVTIRTEIKSVIITFVSVFLLTVALQFKDPAFSFGTDAIAAVAVSAVRAGIKAVASLLVVWFSGAEQPAP